MAQYAGGHDSETTVRQFNVRAIYVAKPVFGLRLVGGRGSGGGGGARQGAKISKIGAQI